MSVIITNKEIYNKLLSIEAQMIENNGKIKLNRWIATTALGGWFLTLGKVMFF